MSWKHVIIAVLGLLFIATAIALMTSEPEGEPLTQGVERATLEPYEGTIKASYHATHEDDTIRCIFPDDVKEVDA